MNHLQVHLHVVLSSELSATNRTRHFHVFHVVLGHQMGIVCTSIMEATSAFITPMSEFSHMMVHVTTKAAL